MVRDNLLLKLVSLLAALLLSYSVNSGRNTSVLSFNVPIEIKNPPEDRVLLRSNRRMAQVTVKGPSFLVAPLVSSPPPLRVVLPDGVAERLQIGLKAGDVPVPSMVQVVGIEPAEIELIFEPLEQRELKVEVPRVGQLRKDLNLTKVEVEPRVAVVKGPRSELKQLRFIESDPLDLGDLSGSQSMTLSLRNPSGQITLLTKSVGVRVGINEVPRQRTFEKRAVELRTSPNLAEVGFEPMEVVVTIEGAPNLVAAVDPSQVVPYVRVRESPPKEGRVIEVSVDLPEGLKVTEIKPASVTVFAGVLAKGAVGHRGDKNRAVKRSKN